MVSTHRAAFATVDPHFHGGFVEFVTRGFVKIETPMKMGVYNAGEYYQGQLALDDARYSRSGNAKPDCVLLLAVLP